MRSCAARASPSRFNTKNAPPSPGTVPCASRENGTRSPSVANCTSPETPSRNGRDSGGVSAPASATSARPLRRSSIAARIAAMPESAPPSSVVAPPENAHSRAMPLAMLLPEPERKLAGSGAGSEPTSSPRTACSVSCGALRKKWAMISIVWSTKNVCWSQVIVDELNGGA